MRDVLCRLPELIAESLSPAYPEVNERLPIIIGEVDKEVDLFKDQIQRSKKLFKQMSRKYRRGPGQIMPGQEAYLFLRQFGAPVELLRLYSDRYDVKVDYDDLNRWIEKYSS